MQLQSICQSHGEYSLAVDGELIVVKAFGAWNVEAKQQIIQDILSLRQQLSNARFGLLVDITEFELGTPEFQQVGRQEKLKLINAGLYKTAYINRTGLVTKVQQLKRMQPAHLAHQAEFFLAEKPARAWLNRS